MKKQDTPVPKVSESTKVLKSISEADRELDEMDDPNESEDEILILHDMLLSKRYCKDTVKLDLFRKTRRAIYYIQIEGNATFISISVIGKIQDFIKK